MGHRDSLSSLSPTHRWIVDNAGVASMNHTLLTPATAFDKMLGTNFRGTFLLCRENAKLMKKRKYGRMVNLSTVAASMRLEGSIQAGGDDLHANPGARAG